MDKNKLYYFVGIKGTGMASMALVLHQLGYKVTGSDVKQVIFTQKPLEKAGIKLKIFNINNISDNPNIVYILGNSFNPKNNVEVKAIVSKQLKYYRYPKFLGKMIEDYISIGIAGTHGKTTTTGMLSYVLNPLTKINYLIGDGRGQGKKNAKYFIYEADEYRRHFLGTYPDYEILNNIDYDHPDYFNSINDCAKAFQQYANHAKKGILVWGEDKRLRKLQANVPIHTFGFKANDDFQAIAIKQDTKGSQFEATYNHKILGKFTIHLFGKYNILHALVVIAISYLENINLTKVQKLLNQYTGEKRRFAHHHVADMEIIDDYAHHPSEILATLGEARQQYPDKKLIVVFQPHTYSRIEAYLPQFGTSLSKADAVYVTKIFSSPRENHGHVTSQDIVNRITKPSAVIKEIDMKPLLKYHHEVVIFMGAGDIPKYEVAYEKLLKQYHK